MSTELLDRARSGDKLAREQLFLENTGLVWSVVRHFTGRGVDQEDLYQLGCVGLIKAMDGFESEYGTRFSTYAVPKIAGEIRRFLRDDGSVKVSRTLKEQAGRIWTARRELTARLGREPRLSELARETGLAPEEIARAETALLPADSLQRPVGEDGGSLEQFLPGDSIEEKLLESMDLRNAIAALAPRQRAVIHMRYDRGMTQEQTAAVLGISQVQVSRIERKALGLLRQALSEEPLL